MNEWLSSNNMIESKLTCIFVDNISPLHMPRDSLNAGLFAAHFLEERVIGLQVQHARALTIVLRFHRIVAIVVAIISHVLIDVGRSHIIGAGQYLWRRIIVADDAVWLLCRAVLCDNFHVGFMIGWLTIVVLAKHIAIYVIRIDNYVWPRPIPQFVVAVRIVGVYYDVFPWRRIDAAHIRTYNVRFIVVRWSKYAEVVVVRNVQVQR